MSEKRKRKMRLLTETFLNIKMDCPDGLDGKFITKDLLYTKNWPDGIPFIEMKDLDTGETVKAWCDGGLSGALEMAKITKGMDIHIDHTGMAPFEFTNPNGIKQKTEVNTYKIYALENED